VHVERDGGIAPLADGAFPAAIGGPGAAVPLEGSAFPLAWLGLAEGDVFVQPAPGATVHCNGTRLAASHWLRDGDVLQLGTARIEVVLRADGAHLRVEPLADANPTEPPVVLVPPPRAQSGRESPSATEGSIKPVPFAPRPIAIAPPRRRRVSPTALLTAVLTILGAAVVFALFTSRAVVLEITPEPDHLSLHGSLPALPLGSRFLVRPGRYTVVAEKEGYRRLEREVEVTPEGQPPFRFTLSPLPGRLVVDTGEVSGAEVVVDGRVVGATPLRGAAVEAGAHDVAVRAEGFVEFHTRLEVAGRGVEERLDVTLQPNSAPVSFASAPEGATVRVDGRALGKTPLTAHVSAGDRRVDVALGGYRPQERRLKVVAGQALTLPAFRLVPADGVLSLTSDPPGATVTVGGAYEGETPVDIALAPGRAHQVRLAKAGHEAGALEVTLGNGEHREATVRLAPLVGEVAVSAQPADAELLVNGEPRGRADQTLRLEAVPQEIEIRREGYLGVKRTVTPRPGFPQSIRVVLKTSEEAREEAMPAVVKTPEGHELRRVDGGRIEMGASRREPGRRANEVQREVELTRPFYVATEEVSNAQFKRFAPGHSSGAAGTRSLDVDDYPVVRVTWEEAAAYCNWLSEREHLPAAYVRKGGGLAAATPLTTGYRLPTEAEWARVARYPDGRTALKYPWGQSLPVPRGGGNFADVSARGLLERVLDDYDDGYPATAPVGSLTPNALGLFHLGDNVAEWVHDFYTMTPSLPGDVERDPTGPTEGEYHVIRGASWMLSTVTELRLSFRDYGKEARPDLGFRVARYAR
jgi:formylglycine-generating enzyme required for sulfatase activity